MQEVRYSRAKLWMLAIVSAHCALFMFALFLNPQYHVRGPYGLIINGSLGHFLTLPVATLTCTALALRCVIIAIGPAVAIVTDSEGATLNTIWRSHRIVWSDLLCVRLMATKRRWSTTYSLKFDRCAGGTISLPLKFLTGPEQRQDYVRLAETLSENHVSAINHSRAGLSKSPLPDAHDRAHLQAPTTSLRPVFGRKSA